MLVESVFGLTLMGKLKEQYFKLVKRNVGKLISSMDTLKNSECRWAEPECRGAGSECKRWSLSCSRCFEEVVGENQLIIDKFSHEKASVILHEQLEQHHCRK